MTTYTILQQHYQAKLTTISPTYNTNVPTRTGPHNTSSHQPDDTTNLLPRLIRPPTTKGGPHLQYLNDTQSSITRVCWSTIRWCYDGYIDDWRQSLCIVIIPGGGGRQWPRKAKDTTIDDTIFIPNKASTAAPQPNIWHPQQASKQLRSRYYRINTICLSSSHIHNTKRGN